MSGNFSGKSDKGSKESLCDEPDVDEEYSQALRTKSYTEIWSKVQSQLKKPSIDHKLSSSASLPIYIHLSDYVLEPRQETLTTMIESSKLHHLLVEFFQATQEACNICESLLRSIHRTRTNHKIIKRIIKLTKRVHEYGSQDQSRAIFKELTTYASLENPFSFFPPVEFRNVHDNYGALFRRLISKRAKIRRRTNFTRFIKSVVRLSLVVSYTAVIVAFLVLLIHSMVGVVAAPGLLACSLGLFKKRVDLARKEIEPGSLQRLGQQFDVAAKGVYILINDFDTTGRLVRRLHDEVEHDRDIAGTCVKNGNVEILKEVVREFQLHEVWFLEQLDELEEHVYLCFLTINRSRRLLMQEIMVAEGFNSQTRSSSE